MGRDIQPLIRHSLDTDDIGRLAAGLAQQLGIRVVYGYNHYPKQLADLYNPNAKDVEEGAWVELGRAGDGTDAPEFVLSDMDFVERELYLKYGDAIVETQAWQDWWYRDAVGYLNLMRNEGVHPHYLLEHVTHEHIYMYVYKGCVDAHLWGTEDTCRFYYMRWGSLYYGIMEPERWGPYDELMTMFRTLHLQLAHQLGGSKVYYTDDQGYTLGQHYFYSMGWDEMEAYIIAKAGQELGDVPALLALDSSVKKHMDAVAFVDDGRDLLPGIDLNGQIWKELIPKGG